MARLGTAIATAAATAYNSERNVSLLGGGSSEDLSEPGRSSPRLASWLAQLQSTASYTAHQSRWTTAAQLAALAFMALWKWL